MKQLPTAEDFLKAKCYVTQDDIEDIHDSVSSVTETMIEFAKLHVEQALKEAIENAELKWVKYTDNDYEVDKDSILNAYPLTNIK